MCTRTVSTLAHVFEAAGIATVAIGSIREQIYNTAPPRGLFCDFPLGRPLGVPQDPAFQHRVLEHALGLLRRDEPSIEDFPEAIEDDATETLVCALPPRHDADAHPALDEARGLRGAYDRAVAKFGNRAGAARLLDADAVPGAIEAFLRVADGTPWKEAGIPGVPARVSQDIRGYYEMAAMEISDHTPAAWSGYRWFRDKTETGKVIRAAQAAIRESGAPEPLWRFLLPLDASM
ncbi:MAG: hypothetical protein QF921_15790 [Pseudomonadales bacterium]|nr:hypothetical protein [Pseudomonadales bacterium]MDP6471232.1 hypothetical protein [Pseudomonadales bacterium]MDP6825579.1 hypothetical protein [Pseudomonadales bacterium]MDP6972946.1 hypothetical protein [Pseudomonadales bacterium]